MSEWNIRHFYFNNDLHRILRINRPANLVEAWNYRIEKPVTLLYSDWKRDGEKAYLSHEVANLLNVHKDTLKRIRREGHIRQPQRSHPLGGTSQRPGNLWWSKKDITEALEYLLTVHQGHPRKDGKITSRATLPSMAELKAKLNNVPTLYVKTASGEFVPTFERPRF
jgi:hypothetical protein